MSKKKDKYTQCKMFGPNMQMHVAWIPKKFAQVGKLLRIDGIEYLLEVVEVWSTRDFDWVTGRERDYLNQRKVSDI